MGSERSDIRAVVIQKNVKNDTVRQEEDEEREIWCKNSLDSEKSEDESEGKEERYETRDMIQEQFGFKKKSGVKNGRKDGKRENVRKRNKKVCKEGVVFGKERT